MANINTLIDSLSDKQKQLIEIYKRKKNIKKISDDYHTIERVEEKEYYEMSSAQKRLFILNRLEESKTSYNIPSVYEIEGALEKERLEAIFSTIIARHETLRTSFEVIDDAPVQKVSKAVEFRIDYREAAIGNVKELVESFVRPFDLSAAPLLRVALIKTGEKRHILLFDMHHIISDGTSMNILIKEFIDLYDGKELPELRIQYRDYSEWQNSLIKNGKMHKQEEYWLNLLAGDIPRINILTDHPRPQEFTYEGDFYELSLGKADTGGLKNLSNEKGVTIFINLIAVLNVLLYKHTQQEDIIIGYGTAGRPHADLHNLIGMFVNSLVMRNYPASEKTYEEFLEEVKNRSIETFENQEYQFDDLVDKLNPERDMSRNPVFDIALVVQNFEVSSVELKGLAIRPYEFEDKTTKFDLAIFVWEGKDTLKIQIEYYTKLFEKESIKRIGDQFIRIIRQVIENPKIKISDIEIISRKEKQKILYEFNATKAEYPCGKTVHQLFEEQAEKTPDNSALVYEEEEISYRELEKRANRIAEYLVERKHIQCDERVGIIMDRNIECITSMLGILKSGGAYVPIDPELPEERIKMIVNDAGTRVVISQKKYVKMLNRIQWDCECFQSFICMDSDNVYEEEEAAGSLMDRKLWEYVGETALDDIEGGGWKSSYTGENLSREEMDEYGDNILKKLSPLLNKTMKVLEIGCASGISMYRLAPHVSMYYGTDLSKTIIEKNRERIKKEGLNNIKLSCFAAHEIDQVEEKDFDVVIINSVIQTFPGHNYLRRVIRMITGLMKEDGYLFIGDVMDQDLKEKMTAELKAFKENNRNSHYRTKTEFTEELFVSRCFFEDLRSEIEDITEAGFSNKIYSIENELTKYRYDVLLKINKGIKNKSGTIGKIKEQEDRRAIEKYTGQRIKTNVKSSNLAYSIYTSGTTGKPKGVMIEHRALLNLIYWHNTAYKVTEKDRSTQYASIGFDASVWEIFPYLVIGAGIYIISNTIKLNMEALNRYYEENGITISFLPTQVCEQFTKYENRTLRVLLTGGDKLYKYNKRRYKLYNNYGPTENTVVTTACEIKEERENIPVGSPIKNTKVYIINSDNQLMPVGAAGELCISGMGLARGYLNNPELTAGKFVHNPFEPGTKMYRTGDLARWLPDGNIEFLGRIDQQVKIRGFRIELGEIESRLLKHEAIKEAVVIVKEDADDNKYLAAYIASINGMTVQELRDYLGKELPEYMIPSYFIQMEKLPLTPNGKINRKALPGPGQSMGTGVGYEGPRNDMEEQLVKIWEEVLGVTRVGINDNFFELGGHSLKAITLTSKIHKETNVEIPLSEVFTRPLLRHMAEYIKESAGSLYTSIEVVPESDYYPLSSAQSRLYILNKIEGQGVAYNMPGTLIIEGNLDKGRLEKAFDMLIKRHETLRTSFEMAGEKPVQRIHEKVEFVLDYYELEERKAKEKIKELIRPFDLSEAPLLRAALIKIEGDRHIMFYDMHHIISDGTTMNIITREFAELYNGMELPALRIQYKDYSAWQNKLFESGIIAKQKEYWVEVFREEVPVLNLPTDYTRPAIQSFEGNNTSFKAGEEIRQKINQLTGETGTTLYMMLLASFNVLLMKYTGQEDIVVGTPIAGRHHADLENIAGMFVNTLAIRNQPEGQKTFKEFLNEVKEKTLKAYENQDYQFEELVENVGIKRDISRNPLFDIVLVLQNTGDVSITLGDLRITPYEIESRVTKFDITLNVVEGRDALYFILEYSSKLFKKETIECMVKHFINILKVVVNNPDVRLGDIEMITGEEKHRILYEFNDTSIEYPADKTIHGLFEEQAERTPDHIAVVYEDRELMYRELNAKSNQLARVLREKGVRPDSIVGIMVERSPEMIIGIMGILKAGGAYLPIDPQYPEERVRYMLEDSRVDILLTQSHLKNKYIQETGKIDLDDNELYTTEDSNLEIINQSCDLAYIMYTSGTTGKPKGVMIEHKNIIRLVKNTNYVKFDVGDRILQTGAIVFDASTFEFWGSLLNGLRLYIVDEETILNIDKFHESLIKNKITIVWLTSSLFNQISQERIDIFKGLKYLLVGGDVLSPKYITKVRQSNKHLKIINGYGPTENTTFSTCFTIEKDYVEKIPIGKPINNSTAYILDKGGNLQPMCVAGELCVGGDGVGRGYLNSPELTAAKFIPNPFKPGGKMYRTGDLTRWLPDGNIEFLGRIDHQVKIRGFRVELGEIESQLLRHGDIKEAVITARENKEGNKYLCAYISAARELTKGELREHLSKELPEYMIPSYFVQMEKLPLTPNGKIDRKALPEPGGSISTGIEYKPPTNAAEEKLAGIWQEILGAAQVGINDNFFELGGHSLKVMNLASMIHREFKVDVDIRELFKHQTIAAQAVIIDDKKNKILELKRYIEEIKEMSDIEIDSLLSEK